MPLLPPTVVHWIGATLTVAFSVCGLLFTDKPRVAEYQKSARMPLPDKLVGVTAFVSHLTICSHLSYSGYFIMALLRDYEILTPTRFGQLFSSTALTMSLFVAVAFWGLAFLGAQNFVPPEIFPAEWSDEQRKIACFKMMFAPQAQWQRMFQRFMVYIHTLCPATMMVDAAISRPGTLELHSEAIAVLTFGCSYLSWNMFCWWFYRKPPYPFQRRIYQRGLPFCILCYGGFLTLSTMMLACGRVMRQPVGSNLLGETLTVGLCGFVLWISAGVKPMTNRLAQLHGIKSLEPVAWDGSLIEKKDDSSAANEDDSSAAKASPTSAQKRGGAQQRSTSPGAPTPTSNEDDKDK